LSTHFGGQSSSTVDSYVEIVRLPASRKYVLDKR
jgi:hypothetical protein